MNPQVLNFLKETLYRLIGKSSKYFIIWQVAFAIFIVLGKVPWFLEEFTYVHVSDKFIRFCNWVSTFAAGAVTSSFLTVDSKPAAVTVDGVVVKKVETEKYPFTKEVTKKEAEKEKVPVIPEHINL